MIYNISYVTYYMYGGGYGEMAKKVIEGDM